MKSFKEYIKKGTYAALKPVNSDAKALHDVCTELHVPNLEPTDKLHCTLLYSRKFLPNYIPEPDREYEGKISGVEIWPTKSGKNCLVIKFKSPDIIKRHNQLMDEHNATHDFSEFKPHISASYDVGDFDISKLKDKLPKDITFSNEYEEELDLTGK